MSCRRAGFRGVLDRRLIDCTGRPPASRLRTVAQRNEGAGNLSTKNVMRRDSRPICLKLYGIKVARRVKHPKNYTHRLGNGGDCHVRNMLWHSRATSVGAALRHMAPRMAMPETMLPLLRRVPFLEQPRPPQSGAREDQSSGGPHYATKIPAPGDSPRHRIPTDHMRPSPRADRDTKAMRDIRAQLIDVVAKTLLRFGEAWPL